MAMGHGVISAQSGVRSEPAAGGVYLYETGTALHHIDRVRIVGSKLGNVNADNGPLLSTAEQGSE